MAWRFKASKYKNTAPKIPKREVQYSNMSFYISDVIIPIGDLCKTLMIV